jgi:serine/threonine-protein kinase
MSGSGAHPGLLGQLADEFLQRYRRGELPALTEYTARHPELAEQIRELFPGLVLMEDIRPDPPTPVGAGPGPGGAGCPRRLGEYRIVREIGRGGMGVVYEAVQESLGRRVALKVLPPGATAVPRQVERFQREARATARLHHSNIVPVFGVGEEGGTHFYVMQYIEGRPLDQVLAELHRLRGEATRGAGTAADPIPPAPDAATPSAAVARSLWNGRFRTAVAPAPPGAARDDRPTLVGPAAALPAPTARPATKEPAAFDPSALLSDPHRPFAKNVAHVGVQVAEALEYAAGQGVLHRDVKPSNLLLDVWGTAWLTDFGLAKATGTPDLTASGDLLGTLYYLAPERFEGRADVRSDVYSLGLTLYEMLALRPAFEPQEQAELVRRVTTADVPRLDRVNPRLPRDLVTIVHKAMAREPADRYQTPGALAEDLRHFLEDRSIVARRVLLPEQVWRWCRRNPSTAALVAAVLALVVLTAGGGLWLERQQAGRRLAVETDLKEVAELQGQARWTEAGAVLERGAARLGGGGPGDLRRRLGQARHDLDLVVRLDGIRMKRVSTGEEGLNNAQADRDYAGAFREARLGEVRDDPGAVAARVRASAVRGALVAALDDWAVSVTDKERRRWLLEVARRADPDPDGWRDRVRDPAAWEDGAALAEWARTAPVAEPSVTLLVALGQRLRATGGDATGYLRRVQREHPADFWANLALAHALKYRGPGEAIAYYRVALAIRPGSAGAYYDLAEVLRFQNWFDEALDYYRKALTIDPRDARAQAALGNLLQEMGRADEAVGYFRGAVRTDPGDASAHTTLANLLKDGGRLDEAGDHFRRAIALAPQNPAPHHGLRSVLLRQGRGEEARLAWQKALAADPPAHDAWDGYAELCLFLGHEEEYRRARRALLDRFGASTDPFVAERTGRACLLLPAPADELRQAAALIDRAVAAGRSKPDWAYPYFLFAGALAEYRQGRLDDAICVLQGDQLKGLGPNPRLILALAQYRQGQKDAARRTLAAAVRDFDWSAAQADNPGTWICHILRREAEALILPDLPAFLAGTHQPRDNDERLALLGACQFKGLHRAAARLYADAFAADPTLSRDWWTESRYRAACCAAQAGCGRGADGDQVSEAERARWRRQALAWLRADLAVHAKRLAGGNAADHRQVQRLMQRWLTDAPLAGVRGAEALGRLPAEERAGWAQLWAEAEALRKKAEELTR